MDGGDYSLKRVEILMSKLRKLYAYARLVKAQTGKPWLRQAMEIRGLASGRQRIGIEEYYELGIFDDDFFPGQEKSRCVGWRSSAKIDRVLNDDSWRATANDKVLIKPATNYARYGLFARRRESSFLLGPRLRGDDKFDCRVNNMVVPE